MRAGEIDSILALPPDEAVEHLATVPESQWFERKSGRISARDLAKPLVGLANAEGGVVVVGIEDGSAVGTTSKAANALRQAAIDHTRPTVRTRITEIEAAAEGPLLVIRVDPSEHVHETGNGDCFLRIGDETRRLTFAQRQELEFDRGPQAYDGTAAGVGTDRLSPALVAAYQAAIGSSTPEDMLAARGLLTQRGEVTVAAYLLFGEQPQDRFPHAHVRVLRYTDTERGSGATFALDAEGDVRCEGSLPAQLHDAAAAIEHLLPKRRRLAASGRFEAMTTIPRDAWLEGLVNAVLHRSYSAAGDNIRVEIFPDRLEITSPGRFPGLVDPTQPMGISRYARNPRVARVCSDLGIAQELGEGIRRIYAEMRRNGLTDPIYTQTADHVRLTLVAADAVPKEILDQLPDGARELLSLLRRVNRPMGTGQIEELSGRTRPTVLRYLRALREADLIDWQGVSAKDPRATWRIR